MMNSVIYTTCNQCQAPLGQYQPYDANLNMPRQLPPPGQSQALELRQPHQQLQSWPGAQTPQQWPNQQIAPQWHDPRHGQTFIINNYNRGDGRVAPYREHKSPVLAAVLSFLFVGMGQVYNGQAGKGLVMFFSCIALWAIMMGWIIHVWSIVDAFATANEKNCRRA
jgi:hypothetical protein